MTRVELPDGNWADLLDPRKISERKRRAYVVAMSEFHKSKVGLPTVVVKVKGDNGDEQDRSLVQCGAESQGLLDAALDLLIVALVSAWSLDMPITADSLADLGIDIFDPLKRACMALSDDVLPNYSPSPDPTVGGEKSSGSPTSLSTVEA